MLIVVHDVETMTKDAVRIRHLSPTDTPNFETWRSVLRLAKANAATLGFLPDSAFADRVRKGTLIVAELDGEVVGYCLYDLPRAGHIKLVHVCIGEAARGYGAGTAMVDAAISVNPNAIGVLAYCRDDYPGIDRFWAACGMAPRGERPGRAAAGSTLIRWWRPLGSLDLIEEAALGSGLPLVVYDTNVVSDLFCSDGLHRDDRQASRGLLAGWLQAAITPAVSNLVDVELNRISDPVERKLQQDRSADLLRLRSETTTSNATLKRLLEVVGAHRVQADRSLVDDLRHLADAISAGASYFVTNDQNLLEIGVVLRGHYSLRIVRPHRLVSELLDQLQQPTFKSRLIESVDLEWGPASRLDTDDLVRAFLSHERNERTADLHRLIRASIATNPSGTRVLSSPDGKLWAIVAETAAAGALEVQLLRVGRGKATGTVAWQLARHLRIVARDSGLASVRVLDPFLASSADEALRADGFAGEPPAATILDAALTRDELAALHPGVEVRDSRELRALERRFWPLNLVGEDVRTFIAPIWPQYAERLFGIDRGYLWAERKTGLGLSREHVYYSGSSRALPPAESRILWYVTHDSTGTLRKVMARSRSLGYERLRPEEAHAANAEVGVFRPREVEKAADASGLVTVLRFEDTELLEPLGGPELESVFQEFRVKKPILSFREVDPKLYDAIVMRNR